MTSIYMTSLSIYQECTKPKTVPVGQRQTGMTIDLLAALKIAVTDKAEMKTTIKGFWE